MASSLSVEHRPHHISASVFHAHFSSCIGICVLHFSVLPETLNIILNQDYINRVAYFLALASINCRRWVLLKLIRVRGNGG